MYRTLLTTHFTCYGSIVVRTGRRKCDINVTLSACHVRASWRNELQRGSGPSSIQRKLLTLHISKWQLTAVTGRVLYSPVLAVNHSVFVLLQLEGAPMIIIHGHRSIRDFQHHARPRVLYVGCHLHKQDRLYSKGENVAAYASVPKTQTRSPCFWNVSILA